MFWPCGPQFSRKCSRQREAGKEAASVEAVLLMVYLPSNERATTKETWRGILDFAHEYQMESIVGKCENFVEDLIWGQEIDLVSALVLAQTYKLETLKRACINCFRKFKSIIYMRKPRQKLISSC